MNYQRVLILTELGTDASATFAAARRFAPAAVQLVVIAVGQGQLAWVMRGAPLDNEPDEMQRSLEELRQAALSVAPTADVMSTPELSVDALSEAVSSGAIDLVVVGQLSMRSLALISELRKRATLSVLFSRALQNADSRSPGARLLAIAVSAREGRTVAQFLREHATPSDQVTLLMRTPADPVDLSELREIWGLPSELQLHVASKLSLRQLLGPPGLSEIDLLVLPRLPPLPFLAASLGPPALVLPFSRATPSEWQRAIDAPDSVDDGRQIHVRLEYAAGIGRRSPIADQMVAFVHSGKIVATRSSTRGQVELPSGLGRSLGIFRNQSNPAGNAALLEAQLGVLRPGPHPLLLFDADIAKEDLPLLRAATWAEPLAVRVRPMRSCDVLRAQLRAAGLPPLIIDASCVLDEGEATDVPEQADGVRLARVAARLRCSGFAIVAIVYRAPRAPAALGFATLLPTQLATFSVKPLGALSQLPSGEQLSAITGTDPIAGNSIEVEMDNRTARNWLLSAIAASRIRVHLQVYMAADDDVGRMVEAALANAAARGVPVRLLVDSLHGLYGSLGLRNPLLERLGAYPGIELRVSKPISSMPSLVELKQRDHRKLAVIDGEVALLGGRNLSHEYYTGFDEVHLTAGLPWRSVPWLEAGARVKGPAVAALERLFLQAWTEAGGRPFDVPVPAPVGQTKARVIGHCGLQDAYSLETYLALLDGACSHIYVVNGFPLLLEIQHALLRALSRGVRVRTLFGNLTPRYGDTLFKGPWAQARAAATSFVHSRMDPLVAARAECYEFVVPHSTAWDTEVGDLRPHVHAKTMSVDGRICVLGSANFDVTAAYWENELVLVIEDAAIATALEGRFDELLRVSRRVDAQDPAWRREAEERRWMRYWPGNLSI